MQTELVGPLSLKSEAWREYDFGGRTYRIAKPMSLFYRRGGATHRVVDQTGVVHCIPAPGIGDCILRWRNKNAKKPVNF